MKTRIFQGLDPRQERLPADTSRTVTKKPMRTVPLANPDLMVTSHPGINRLLADYSVVNPRMIRAETRDRLYRMVESANAQIAKSAKYRAIRFDVDESSGRAVAVVRDSRSGQVLKQIPSEQMLEMAGRLKDASGLLQDITI